MRKEDIAPPTPSPILVLFLARRGWFGTRGLLGDGGDLGGFGATAAGPPRGVGRV